MSRNRDFVSELLNQQQQRQAAPQGRPQQLGQALRQPVQGQPISEQQRTALPTGGLVSISELDSRELLANSLLEQSRDRGAHPLARGISAFFGAKATQDIGAERTKTERALAEAEQRKEELERQERLTLSDRREARKDEELGLEREGLDIRRRQSDAAIEANRLQQARQESQDALSAQDRQRRLELEERKLQLEEAKANQVISDKEVKAELEEVERESNLIDGVSSAELTITQIDELLAHPGFTGAVGAGFQKSVPFSGAGDIEKVGGGFAAGSDAASFTERLKQLKGGAFLEARQLLKGGGSISDTESNKAEAAQTRMSLAQSEDEFRKAAIEYQDIIKTGLERQKEKASKLGVTLEDKQRDVGDLSDEELEAIINAQ